MKITLIKNGLKPEDRKFYENVNPGFEVTDDLLKFEGDDRTSTYIILKGKCTPYDCVRDCGDHWIKAQYDRYDRIDKGTFKVTKDAGDR